jgi:hypothetical protein
MAGQCSAFFPFGNIFKVGSANLSSYRDVGSLVCRALRLSVLRVSQILITDNTPKMRDCPVSVLFWRVHHTSLPNAGRRASLPRIEARATGTRPPEDDDDLEFPRNCY